MSRRSAAGVSVALLLPNKIARETSLVTTSAWLRPAETSRAI